MLRNTPAPFHACWKQVIVEWDAVTVLSEGNAMSEMSEPTLEVIGRVRSSLTTTQDPPPDGRHSLQEATLDIFPAYCMGLAGMDELDKLVVLYWLDQADRAVLLSGWRSQQGDDRGILQP